MLRHKSPGTQIGNVGQWGSVAPAAMPAVQSKRSGVSAGIDMSLRLISLILDEAAATLAANWAEYEWHRNPEWDPFSEIWGKA